MFKSVTARAIVPVAVAVTGFVIVCCILLYSVMKRDMVSDAISYETNQADTIVKSTRYAMLKSDREMLRNIIGNIGEQKGVEHVRIFNKKGLIMFSRNHGEVNRFVDKKTAGCVACHAGAVPSATLGGMQQARRFVNERGAEVLAITAPIYNEAECFNAACHFHSAGQKVLGTLDIGLSAAPLAENLSMAKKRMTAFSVMVLLLTVGGVAALLRRNVFLPIKSLTEFTDKGEDGILTSRFTASGELGKLAGNFSRLAAELQRTREELAKSREGGVRREDVEEAVELNAVYVKIPNLDMPEHNHHYEKARQYATPAKSQSQGSELRRDPPEHDG